ncbi:hypothetical protein TrVE_jg11092 [Triparma verrucosa]|uniref:DUF7726 domain-containing protein n=1 Tax=Triparma verrucosa TaxID=1606542 RepID=A0A9W7C7Q5_9STRA|nr:hypothetical protein TrVE_jg11092 [Triparma verrucosa]
MTKESEGEAKAKNSKKSRNDLLLSKVCSIELVDSRVFDTCDEVRVKALNFVALHKCSRASFLRALCQSNPVKPNSWKAFVGFRGEFAGANNRSYYLAYFFLEKLRVLQGEPKSVSRIASEKKFPNGRPFTHSREEEPSNGMFAQHFMGMTTGGYNVPVPVMPMPAPPIPQMPPIPTSSYSSYPSSIPIPVPQVPPVPQPMMYVPQMQMLTPAEYTQAYNQGAQMAQVGYTTPAPAIPMPPAPAPASTPAPTSNPEDPVEPPAPGASPTNSTPSQALQGAAATLLSAPEESNVSEL